MDALSIAVLPYNQRAYWSSVLAAKSFHYDAGLPLAYAPISAR